MVFKDHPKRKLLINLIIVVITLLIILLAILPFLNIQSNVVKGILIILAILITAYPMFKYFYKKKKDKKHKLK